MKAIFQWIIDNPSAVKAYMLAVLALVGKGILAATGKVADLGQWAGFVDQTIDVVVGGLSIYGLIAGSIHSARGPLLTSTDQAAVIAAAIAPVLVPVPEAPLPSVQSPPASPPPKPAVNTLPHLVDDSTGV